MVISEYPDHRRRDLIGEHHGGGRSLYGRRVLCGRRGVNLNDCGRGESGLGHAVVEPSRVDTARDRI